MSERFNPTTARKYYDRLGSRYDWFEFYEAAAKHRAFQRLNLESGCRFLNVGVGTGKDQLELQSQVMPQGLAVGMDLSPKMARLAQTRTGGPILEADTVSLPFVAGSFDRVLAAYLLDLMPLPKIPGILAEYSRVLTSGGLLVLLSLTEGVDRASRTLVSIWKSVYRLSPSFCGGCRPLMLGKLVSRAGFEILDQEVVVQWGLPSEITLARR